MEYADGLPRSEASDSDTDEASSAATSDGGVASNGRDGDTFTGEGSTANGGDDDAAPAVPSETFINLQSAVLCNQAACYLKLGEASAALETADRAVLLKPIKASLAGVKAAYRRACALEALGRAEEAREAFKGILGVDSTNTASLQARMTSNTRNDATFGMLPSLE